MEEIVTCSICAQVFDSANLIPKILECGHTFCSPCLIKLFQNNPSCPNCRAEIKGTESSLPINYSTLKVVDIYKSKNWSEKIMNITTEVTKRKDIILKKKAEMMLSLEVLDKCLEKLEKLTISENQRIDTVNVTKILNEVDEDLKKTDNVVCYEDKKNLSFLLSAFKDSKEYLLEIYNRLSNGEQIYAIQNIDNSVKYGQLSIYDKKIMFNSLSFTEAPRDSSLILFDDLKQCVHSLELFTFIKIICDSNKKSCTLIFQILDRNMSEIFIKLCTGECGPSFVDCFYKRGTSKYPSFQTIFRLDSELEAKKLMEYKNCLFQCTSEEYKVFCLPNEMFLEMNPDGNVDLYRCAITVRENVPFYPHAKVIFPDTLNSCINFTDSWFLKVVECGILFIPTQQ